MRTKTRPVCGQIIVLKPDGSTEVRQLTNEPELETLHEIVGGYIEAVPYFRTIEVNGAVHNCIAFCNENGKAQNLPINRYATLAWDQALRRAGVTTGLKHVPGSLIPPDHTGLADHLVGQIAVVTGDDVLRAMMTDDDDDEKERD